MASIRAEFVSLFPGQSLDDAPDALVEAVGLILTWAAASPRMRRHLTSGDLLWDDGLVLEVSVGQATLLWPVSQDVASTLLPTLAAWTYDTEARWSEVRPRRADDPADHARVLVGF